MCKQMYDNISSSISESTLMYYCANWTKKTGSNTEYQMGNCCDVMWRECFCHLSGWQNCTQFWNTWQPRTLPSVSDWRGYWAPRQRRPAGSCRAGGGPRCTPLGSWPVGKSALTAGTQTAYWWGRQCLLRHSGGLWHNPPVMSGKEREERG